MWAALTVFLLAVAAAPSQQEETTQVAELLLVVEKSVMDKFIEFDEAKNFGQAKDLVKKEIGYFVTEIGKHLETIKGQNIKLGLRKFIQVRSNIVDSTCDLASFQRYLKRKRHYRKLKYDLAVLFTGRNGPKEEAGCARLGSLCGEDAVAVVSFHGNYQGVLTAAHEIGHILGVAVHDPPKSGWIMSPTCSATGIGLRWWFSNESIAQINTHFAKALTEGNNCLLKTHADTTFPNQIAPKPMKNPDSICVRYKGKHGFYWRKGTGYDSGDHLCVWMTCSDGINFGGNWHMISDGMTCNSGKACHRGKCIDDPNAPTDVPEKCLFGDQKKSHVFRDGKQVLVPCSDETTLCTKPDERRQCCGTCSKKAVPGCPGGDNPYMKINGEKLPCKEATVRMGCTFYWTRVQCCATCKAKETGDPSCPYGNYGDVVVNSVKTSCEELEKQGRLSCQYSYFKSRCCGTCRKRTAE